MFQNDLVVLTADPTTTDVTRILLTERCRSLGIRVPKTHFETHPLRDNGVVNGADTFLQRHCRIYRYALVICDLHGCGMHRTREEVEAHLENRLTANGWDGRCAAVVIDPELEIWFWQRAPLVAEALGWTEGIDDLWKWMADQGYRPPGAAKPKEAKSCFREALRVKRTQRSRTIFTRVAAKVTLTGCTDPAFRKFTDALTAWFSPKQES